MSEPTHTKGPWRLEEFDQAWLLIGADGSVIETIYKGDGSQEANARLIVKSPELLDALRDCMLELSYVLDKGNAGVLTSNSNRVIEAANTLLNRFVPRMAPADTSQSV